MSDEKKTFGEQIAEMGTVVENPFGYVPTEWMTMGVPVEFAPNLYMARSIGTIQAEDEGTGEILLSGLSVLVQVERNGRKTQVIMNLVPLLEAATQNALNALINAETASQKTE